jgi:hypothetical protein
MATSTYKGAIQCGALSAKYQADYSNDGSGLVVMDYAETGGTNPQVSHGAVAPGGFATVSIQTTKAGLMEVIVTMGHEDDSGRLTVSRNGTVVDDDSIQGSVRWTYSVTA